MDIILTLIWNGKIQSSTKPRCNLTIDRIRRGAAIAQQRARLLIERIRIGTILHGLRVDKNVQACAFQRGTAERSGNARVADGDHAASFRASVNERERMDTGLHDLKRWLHSTL